MPNSCKSQNFSAVKPTKFYDSVFKENSPPPLPEFDNTVFKENISPWPRIQERLELFPGLVNRLIWPCVIVSSDPFKLHCALVCPTSLFYCL